MASSDREIGLVLVTGATGFVGAELTRALLKRGHEVRVLVRERAAAEAWLAAGAKPHVGDLRQPESLKRALEGVKTVFHSAALLGPPSAPEEAFRAANVDGTKNLVEASIAEGVERFIHVSSVAVSGGAPSCEPVDEGWQGEPRGRYAISKRLAEDLFAGYTEARMEVVIVRPGLVYGARSITTRKLFRLIETGRMVVIGNGANGVQPLAIEDLVEALVLAASSKTISGRVYNIVGPTPLTTMQMCEQIAAAYGVAPPRIRIPVALARVAAFACETMLPAGLRRLPIDSTKVDFFQLHHVYSWQRAAEDLKWRPMIDFASGARRIASGGAG